MEAVGAKQSNIAKEEREKEMLSVPHVVDKGHQIRAEAEPQIKLEDLSMTAQDKLNAAIRQHQKLS